MREGKSGGGPLDDAKAYKVSTIDYFAQGGEGYSPFAAATKNEPLGKLLRDVLADCARKQRLLVPPQGGRMRPIGDSR